MEKTKHSPDAAERERLCRSLGFSGLLELHHTIESGARLGTKVLSRRGLDAPKLEKLGYSAEGMAKLGYSAEALARLGFGKRDAPRAATPIENVEHEGQSVRELIASGCGASQLKELGITAHHCKKENLGPEDLHRLGFHLAELAPIYPAHELRRAGFRPTELLTYFSGQELKSAGFSAPEMRTAGFSARDLIKFAYNENHIISAGYSINELLREGLSLRVVDRKKFR